MSQLIVYDDDSLIESYNVSQKAVLPRRPTNTDFDNDYIYAGERYDGEPINSEPDAMVFTYANGDRTCINREIEFYHTVSTFSYDSITSADNTVYTFFIELINNSYADKRNYINTISFAITQKYLFDFYKNTLLTNSTVSVQEIGDEILQLIVKGVNFTLISYIKIILGTWKNSSFSDVDVTPQILINVTNATTIFTTIIDYDAFYTKNYLEQLYSAGKITFEELNSGDPMRQRAKNTLVLMRM